MMSKDTEIGALTAEQVVAAFNQPSVLVNKFYVNATPEVVRVAFVDEVGTSSAFMPRGVFVMTCADAESLVEVITRTLRQVKERSNPGLQTPERLANSGPAGPK